jgi:hypothetical protein
MISLSKRYSDLLEQSRIHPFNNITSTDIPTGSGIYCFCWVDKTLDLHSIQTEIIIKAGKAKQHHSIKLINWYYDELENKPLYIGKATNLRSRIFQNHLRSSSSNERTLNWWLGQIMPNKQPETTLNDHIGISWILELSDVQRFFMENMFIGILKPWFNLKSES